MTDARFPAFDAFQTRYLDGESQIVWTRLIDDLETPVAAYLKLGHGKPYAFLYESVEGGAWRGRYSIIALDPDLVWRASGDTAEISAGADISKGVFVPELVDTLTSLRRLVDACRLPIPAPLPPMAAGLFGVLGYDMIRLVEPLGRSRGLPRHRCEGTGSGAAAAVSGARARGREVAR
jgi:anthranilate synthase component 1